MNEDQRTTVIPELDTLAQQAKAIEKELDFLQSRLQLYRDPALNRAATSANHLVGTLRDLSDTLKRSGADWIRSYVAGWYRDLHYDMHPRVEVSEDEITDPVFESITYEGNDTWTIMMTTPTHGRERVVVNSDTATWEQVYSADPW